MAQVLVRSLALILLLGVAGSAHAAPLLGETATVDFFFPDMTTLYCSNGSAVIGAGVEYPVGCSGFSPVSIDIADTTLIVDHSNASFANSAFNGFRVDIAGFDFTSAIYAGGGLGVTNITIIDGDLWLDFAGQGTGRALFDISAASVPEPSTLLLLTAALGAGIARRRRV